MKMLQEVLVWNHVLKTHECHFIRVFWAVVTVGGEKRGGRGLERMGGGVRAWV